MFVNNNHAPLKTPRSSNTSYHQQLVKTAGESVSFLSWTNIVVDRFSHPTLLSLFLFNCVENALKYEFIFLTFHLVSVFLFFSTVEKAFKSL